MIGCCVGHAVSSALRSGPAAAHASSPPVRRRSSCWAIERSRMPALVERHDAVGGPLQPLADLGCAVNTIRRTPIGTTTSSVGGRMPSMAASSSSSSIAASPFARAAAGSSTPVMSTFGTHRSSTVVWRTLRSPSDGRTLPM